MQKYIIEVYGKPEGDRWSCHHCDGTYDKADKLNMAIFEALADEGVLYVRVGMEEDD